MRYWRELPELMGPRALRPWLALPASLTAALRRAYRGQGGHGVCVRVLGTGRGPASPWERRELGLRTGERVYWRDVLLHGGDPERSGIEARTVVPVRALLRGLLPLTRQGRRPIGDFLFRHRRLRRSPIRVSRRRQDGRWHWARRSHLCRGRAAALVEERFLPHLPAWRGRGRR